MQDEKNELIKQNSNLNQKLEESNINLKKNEELINKYYEQNNKIII